MKMCQICFILLLAGTFYSQDSFDYLDIKAQTVQTTHQLKYKLKINKSFKLLGKTNHQPTFDKKKFNVSLAAYASGDSFVMIHAETHTDGSGGIDYSNLRPEKFEGIDFTTREQCAELAPSDIAEEHDIKFLADNGFNPLPAVFLKQYLTTSPDGAAEVVISYGKRVSNCKPGAISEKFKREAARGLRSALRIVKKD